MKNLFKSFVTIFAMVVGITFTYGQAPVVSDEGNAAVSINGTSVPTIQMLNPFGKGRGHALPAAGGNVPTITVVASAGPLLSSPDFPAFATDFLLAAYSGNFSSGDASTTKFLKLGKLDPYHLMGGKTIWFAVIVESPSPFMPTNLTSQIVSSPNNLFGKIEVYNDLDLVYAGTSRGEKTDGNGVKTLVTGGRWSETMVTKFAFLGTASKTMNASNQAQMDANAGWMNGFSNFTLEVAWGIKLDGVQYSKSLVIGTHPFVLDPPTIVITRDGNGVKVSSSDLPAGISADVLQSPNWSVVGTITGTQALAIPAGQSVEFFRLRVVQ
jgi:hypothetical protein